MKKVLSLVAAAVVIAAGAYAGDTTFRQDDAASAERAQQLSTDHLRGQIAGRGISSDDLKVKNVQIDELSMAHTRVQQTHGGVPVFGGEAIVHLDANGDKFAVTDNLVDNVRADVTPTITKRQAIRRALAAAGLKASTSEPKADLFILRVGNQDLLVWRVQLWNEDGSSDTSMPVLFMDARNGSQVYGYDNLQTGSGTSLYSGTVTVNSSLVSTTYYMEDLTNKLGTFDNRNTPSTNTGAGSSYRYTDTNDVWDSTSQKAGVDAHYGSLRTYLYFKNVHGRNGIDGSGGPAYYTSANTTTPTGLITSKVHYGVSYNNAYWNGSFMTYGDGNGTTFSPLVSIDIAGHEMTHGVTERTAGLTYERESGALNESFSDVFGAMVERYTLGENSNTWAIGEKCYTPGTAGDAMRWMDEPSRVGDPDHYSEAVYLNEAVCNPNTNDSCGVHYNSGIANKAFYLVAKGGTHSNGGSMTGIGADDAAKIWFKALTTYMTSSTNFAGARTATLNSATALFGASSTQYTATCQAWALVGVGSTCSGGGGTSTELITNGGFEGTSTSPWVRATNFAWTTTGAYPHGGVGYIYAGHTNSANTSAYQQIAIPSTATAAGSFWLQISSNETTTTNVYDQLFVEVRNTSGTLLTTLSTYSNLNKGAYTQKTFSLAAYKGQTVRLQFRVTTDASLTTTFRIDDVSVK